MRLFDSFSSILTKKTRKRLEGWQSVFRNVILELMPVEQISKHFDPVTIQGTLHNENLSRKKCFL